MLKLAPIVLFVYNRPNHTKRTIEYLRNNNLANLSELFIFSDSAKNTTDKNKVNEVRSIIKNISGFKKVEIVKRKKNYGLSKNIICGINKIFKTYKSAIILEDDIETSKYFLIFMNKALLKYEKNKNIWHISGWNYPIEQKVKKKIKDEIFFWKIMNCWGWATWRNRWKYYKKNPNELIKNWNKEKIKKFNLEGNYNFWMQVQNNYKKISNTWAIFWMTTIFEKNGYCLNPVSSYVFNSGNDNSGENTSDIIDYSSSLNSKLIKNWSKFDKNFTHIINHIIESNFKKKKLLTILKSKFYKYM
tara:strand:+ start:56 stop:961 length:906 start_codon:yes stop_codon:yes gene_type:complete